MNNPFKFKRYYCYPHKEVREFIEGFKRFDRSGEVTRTFSNGYCYYFAFILSVRFCHSRIMYYPVGKHFACEIDGRIYDITGDITEKNLSFIPWDEYQVEEQDDAVQVMIKCIMKTGI